MAESGTPQAQQGYSLRVRRSAARAAVAASRNTGRPVDPRVKRIAELTDDEVAAIDAGRQTLDLTG
jgi:hypothetical protein